MAAFPTFAVLDITTTRAPIWSTHLFLAASGKEVRSTSQSAVRYRYTLKVNGLRYGVTGYAAWSAATTYALGDRASSSGHDYQSLQANNLNHAVSNGTWWSDLGVSDEQRRLVEHLLANSGRLGQFTYVDPWDGVTQNVRYDMDELELERVVVGVWKTATIKMITVI